MSWYLNFHVVGPLLVLLNVADFSCRVLWRRQKCMWDITDLLRGRVMPLTLPVAARSIPLRIICSVWKTVVPRDTVQAEDVGRIMSFE